jgi:hypothetical protein
MLTEWGAMTGTLGANAMWDWMPFMAGLKLVKKALMPTGIQHMELKERWRPLRIRVPAVTVCHIA